MKNDRNLTQGFLVAGFLVLAIGLLTGTAEAVNVNCKPGQPNAIANALTQAVPGEPLIVVIKRTCTENVTITADDVTLRGHPGVGGTVVAADPTQDTIFINGARRVVIDNLTVRGGRNGVNGVGGAELTVQNSIIRDNAGIGLSLNRDSSAVIFDNEILANGAQGVNVNFSGSAFIGVNGNEPGPNLIANNGSDGIFVGNSSSAFVFANTIELNGGSGIDIFSSSGRSLGNTIQGNSGNGITVFDNASLFQGPAGFSTPPTRDTIQANLGFGVLGGNNSALRFRDATINGNVLGEISLNGPNATLAISNSDISGNGGDGIFLIQGAGLLMQPPAVTITGHSSFGIQCNDTESSVTGNTTGVTGNTLGQVSPSCTGF